MIPDAWIMNESDMKEQRRRVVLTACVLGAIAFLIFIAFVLSGILSS